MGYFCEYKKKRGASPLPVPRVKAFALPCKSKRATLKAPRRCKYIIRPNASCVKNGVWRHQVHGYNTPLGAFPLLCFWLTVWSCEVLTRQNQSVSNAFYVYMSSRLSPYRAFSIAKFSIQPCQYILHWHRVRRCKCNTLFWNSKESIILFKIIGVIIPNRSLEKVSCHFLMTSKFAEESN